MIRVLAIGDIMGKAGRRSLDLLLPQARQEFKPDIVIANGENVAGGFGITKKLYDQLTNNFAIDCITTGNHWHDKREIHQYLPEARRLLIPANMMNVDTLEHGYRVFETNSGLKYAVINLIGNAFMHASNRNPFHALDQIQARISSEVKIRILDMHAEATSEKQGIAQYASGSLSLVFGTHSHVPTADERILNEETGFVTDIGMTGAYDSVIGIRKEAAINRMMNGEKKRFEPATKDLWLCFIVADICPKTGRCCDIRRFRWELNLLRDKSEVTVDPSN